MQITNNFENFDFDVFIFELDAEGKSVDLDCYKESVFNNNFAKDCQFGQNGVDTEILTNTEAITKILKSATESNDKDKIVIIDNTPYPKDGAYAGDSIILEYASSSSYTMSYNLRSVSIYMGIASLILSFGIGSLTYMSIKVNKDIKKKFERDYESDNEEEEEEEDDEQEDPDKSPDEKV